MSKITPFLWFDTQAEEAANFYISIFPNSQVLTITHYIGQAVEEISGKKTGSVMTVEFELDGTRFTALNGGPNFKFSEAISFVVSCKDQEEIDYFWEKLAADPEGGQCGWLKDKFGLSWQIIPDNMGELIKSEEAMNAMLKMKKINIEELREASQR